MVNRMYDLIFPSIGPLTKNAKACDHLVLCDGAVIPSRIVSPLSDTLSKSKFAFPGHIRHWILQSLGVKWRNHKTNLKAEHWDCRPIEEIMESVPAGVDATQWCHLVNQWSQPKDKERAAINAANAKKQTCPHTMGRVSSVRRQQEMAIKDRLLLWRVNRLRKDGTWSSEDANQRWVELHPSNDKLENNVILNVELLENKIDVLSEKKANNADVSNNDI
ncbi:hypothetical protein MA16_Dca005392 [Dendrobium catenatum]|uniref:Uncharacterized protein n=1 Tax=Dendrobium catenatum TaxID=906689 RepID=A0A2I0X3C5_9ASPA|nr:hypothetical protein MA16_Dca005392 [Dendrobium catenatum]